MNNKYDSMLYEYQSNYPITNDDRDELISEDEFEQWSDTVKEIWRGKNNYFDPDLDRFGGY